MKELSQQTILFRDNGLFQPVAHRLARDCKRLLYYTDNERAFSKLEEAVPGDGFEDIERCSDIWEVRHEIDCAVYPDLGHSGEQAVWDEMKIPVWGGRKGDELELNRELFLKALKRCGLEVPEFEVVVGLSNLRKYLEEKEDCFIKVSRWRGNFETSHFRSMKEDRGLLDLWGVKFGPLSELIRFIVFPNIKTDLEIGCDTFNIRGQWPSKVLHGIEWKDRSYFAAVMEREDMPQQIQDVMDCFHKELSAVGYCGAFSIEDRIKDDVGYFIDGTLRFGLPSTATQTQMKNFSQVIYAGAQGELLEPDFGFKFSAESIVSMKRDPSLWGSIPMPKELEGHLMLTGCCNVDGLMRFPPTEGEGDEVGWLVATGDDQEEVIHMMNELADALPDGMDANTECLAYVLKEIHDAKKEGVEFSPEPTPEPAVVMT